MNELQIFNFNGANVRIIAKDGEPWFVAKDVAEALGYAWNGTQRIAHVPEEWRGVTSVVTPYGNQEMAILYEQGLYFFLARSDKPLALPFQKRVAGEILPAIRKHGLYATPATAEKILNDPDFLIKALTALKEEREQKALLQAQITIDAPKVQLAEAIMRTEGTISVGALAKILKGNGLDIGQNRLFRWMRENGYLMTRGSDYNVPTQWAMELGLFKVTELPVPIPGYGEEIRKTPTVTGKGQQYFINYFTTKLKNVN